MGSCYPFFAPVLRHCTWQHHNTSHCICCKHWANMRREVSAWETRPLVWKSAEQSAAMASAAKAGDFVITASPHAYFSYLASLTICTRTRCAMEYDSACHQLVASIAGQGCTAVWSITYMCHSYVEQQCICSSSDALHAELCWLPCGKEIRWSLLQGVVLQQFEPGTVACMLSWPLQCVSNETALSKNIGQLAYCRHEMNLAC